MMDRLTSMAVFVKTADTGSFAAAALAFDISAQMAGRHVAELEARIGGQLLNRTTRRQNLTEIGLEFYRRCKQLLADAEEAEAVASNLSTTPRGRLRVTAPVTFGLFGLAPLVAPYLLDRPEVEIDLTLTDRYVDLIGEGFDAAIRLGPLVDSSLVSAIPSPHAGHARLPLPASARLAYPVPHKSGTPSAMVSGAAARASQSSLPSDIQKCSINPSHKVLLPRLPCCNVFAGYSTRQCSRSSAHV